MELTENKDFQEIDLKMEVANIGFGKDEYKTSKPNILRNDAVIQEILNISEAAETAIGHTIGPYADSTLIQTFADREVPVFGTHDGYTIMKHMKFTQPIPNAVFNIIKETSEYLNTEIGDSTSSGIPIQNALLKTFIHVFNNEKRSEWKISPVGISNISKVCADVIIDGIMGNPVYQVKFPSSTNGVYTKEQEDLIVDWLTKVATISCNNDRKTGRRIAELYRNKLDGRGQVLPFKSRTEEEYVEESNAFILAPGGLVDFHKMVNSSDGFTYEAENPLIALFDGPLEETDLPAFKQIVQTAAFDLRRPLFFTASFINFNIMQYIKNCIDGVMYNEIGEEINDPKSNPDAKPVKVNIAGVIVRNKEVSEQFVFQDLTLMTNSKPFSTELGKLKKFSEHREIRKKQLSGMFGTCGHISSSWAETNFIDCEPNKEEFDRIISDLKEKSERIKKVHNHNMDYTSDDLNMRVDRLQARTTFYYCGGHSDNAKFSRRLVVEDGVKSVAAAIKAGGISIGGNIAISHYIHHNYTELLDKVLDAIKVIGTNICASENENNLHNIVGLILEAIEFSFGHAYRYALYNMFRNEKTTMKIWNECINSERPMIFNIMTNKYEYLDENIANCTNIMVPCNTDKCLMRFIIENVGNLITIGNMISLMSPNMDLEQLQLKQLETGAAYMAQNSVMRQ